MSADGTECECRLVSALYNMSNPVFLPRWQQMERVAQSVGMKPHLLDVRKREDFGRQACGVPV